MKLSNGEINKVIAILSSLPCSGLSDEEIENIIEFIDSFSELKKQVNQIVESKEVVDEKNRKLIELTNKDTEVSVFLLPSIIKKIKNSDILVQDFILLKSIQK